MREAIPRFLFDRRDHELLRIVNDVSNREQSFEYARRIYYAYFHANGIKEMAESKGLRIAFAVVHLLSSLEIGRVEQRLSALRLLRDEILDTAVGMLPKNTARVLLEIMKELVRSAGNHRRQLELAHDFRVTASGKPRIVRRMLKRYHLLEMPEEWNQIAFDDHVHDVNTKGRKSSTHLIMDAWIKGIRRLRVIHYNYIEPRFAAELLEAAAVMGIDVRIGIEFPTRFRDRYVQLIWVPRGFPDAQAFLCFLAEKPVMQLMEQGMAVSAYQQAYVMELLEAFNRRHRSEICAACQIELPPLDKAEFLKFVGIGQKSKLHLSKFIHEKILRALQQRNQTSETKCPVEGRRPAGAGSADNQPPGRLDLEQLVESYLAPGKNPDIPNPSIPCDGPEVPALLRLSPPDLLERLLSLHSGHRITLNLSNIRAEDALELLYDCEGAITRLEIFNLKDFAAGQTDELPAINELQQAINEGNAVALKRVIHKLIQRVEASDFADKAQRVEKLNTILHDLLYFKALYQGTPLKARIGSDSTGRSRRSHGMGLAVVETLPARSRRMVRRQAGRSREIIPVHMAVYRRVKFVTNAGNGFGLPDHNPGTARLPWPPLLSRHQLVDWEVQDSSIRLKNPGNMVTLGGIQKDSANGLAFDDGTATGPAPKFSWRYLNTRLKNTLKVIFGFIPAFATFALTKDWWVLAYGGAFIWFGITGLRNILQSVLGGGGLRRSPLLRWNDYVSWDRLTDSLLYTGFSVPLLDFVVKTLILDRGLNINTHTSPMVLYTCMALANGIYLSSHNALRGLPRGAVVANFFRSVLSIPIAVAFNAAAGGILSAAAVPGVDAVLQKWAAVISKAASDLVAGFIEGLADRYINIRMRFRDYRKKLRELIDVYTQLEMLFPEDHTADILERPRRAESETNAEARDLEKIVMVHALDMLYFWMYQPRARTALQRLMEALSEEERQILVISQLVLERQREISQMFIDGVLGKDFARALSFYLSRAPEYLEFMKRQAE
jgi:hypothetical protein